MDAFNPDYALAVILQAKYNKEAKGKTEKRREVIKKEKEKMKEKENVAVIPYNGRRILPATSLVDPEWELTDPTPDIYGLFMAFNDRFFWGHLNRVEVRWSPRMTSCAGVCVYEGRHGLCSVRLSAPLLKLRPRSDLIETLLHEMIHAYLFVTNNDRDRDGHGPRFHEHMYRINKEAGTNITVYHSFHDEVRLYQQHWWRCDGPCRYRKPYYGFVKRAMNRAPGPSDFWYADHQATCGGTFIKVKEPENFKNKDSKDTNKPESKKQKSPGSDIRSFLTPASSSEPFGSDVKKRKPINNVMSFSDLIKPKSNDNIAGNNKYPSNRVNNIVGFSDLNSANTAKPKPQMNGKNISFKDSTSKNNATGKTIKGGSISNKGRENVPKSPVSPATGGNNLGFKNLTNNYEKKIENSGGFQRGGGILANRGGGTLVVTDRHKQIKNGETSVNQSDSISTNLRLDNFKPFQGTGFTVGGGSSKEHDRFKSRLLNESAPKKIKIEDETVTVENLDCECGNNDNKCNCPVCNICIPRNEMTLHLENCSGLQNVFNDSDNFELSDDENEDTGGSTEQVNSDTVPCPCCSKLFKESDINQHLDECLTMIALKELE